MLLMKLNSLNLVKNYNHYIMMRLNIDTDDCKFNNLKLNL